MESETMKTNQAVALSFLYMTGGTAAFIGLATGGANAIWAKDLTEAGSSTLLTFYLLIAALAVESLWHPSKNSAYWLARWQTRTSIGRCGGLGFAASLLSAILFLLFTILLPLISDRFHFNDLARTISTEAILPIDYLMLVILTPLTSIIGLLRAKKMAAAQEATS